MLTQDFRYQGLTFPSGTALDSRYGFDFYRVSYLYNFRDGPNEELSIGGSLQLRDADNAFESADGTLRRTASNLGPVPTLKLRARHTFESGLWLQLEADGIYAPVKLLNGSKTDVVGAFYDVAARAGLRAGPADPYVFLRYFGGGAEGSGTRATAFDDGYTKNWLQFLWAGVGVVLR